jgi:molybdenum cofactor biosynthesis enzyme
MQYPEVELGQIFQVTCGLAGDLHVSTLDLIPGLCHSVDLDPVTIELAVESFVTIKC